MSARKSLSMSAIMRQLLRMNTGRAQAGNTSPAHSVTIKRTATGDWAFDVTSSGSNVAMAGIDARTEAEKVQEWIDAQKFREQEARNAEVKRKLEESARLRGLSA